jgi:hypothetical protein
MRSHEPLLASCHAFRMTTLVSVIPVRIVSEPFDIPSLLSFIAALIALGIGVAALVQANRASKQIAVERRTVFELEVLRELLLSIKGGGEVFNRTSPGLVNALPPTELPLWRELIELRGTGDQPPGFDDAVQRTLDRHGVPADLNGERLAHGLANDISAAIKMRVGPHRARGPESGNASLSGLLRDSAHLRQARSQRLRCYPEVAETTLDRPSERARSRLRRPTA